MCIRDSASSASLRPELCGSSAVAAVRIAVSGVRRSCETERRTAVFVSSLRRSSAVSTTSAWSSARCSDAASIDCNVGTMRAATRARSDAPRVAGSSRVPILESRSRSANATRRSSPAASPSSIAAELTPIATASRCAASASATSRREPPGDVYKRQPYELLRELPGVDLRIVADRTQLPPVSP